MKATEYNALRVKLRKHIGPANIARWNLLLLLIADLSKLLQVCPTWPNVAERRESVMAMASDMAGEEFRWIWFNVHFEFLIL